MGIQQQEHLLTMYRVVVLAKLVSHVFSESCEFNHQTQDFTINFEGSEFTLKIDDESGTVTTTARPSTHSAPVTTVTPITTAETTTSDYYVSVVNPEETDKPYEYGPTAAQTAIIENNNGVKGKWTVCPFGGENGESIQDHKNSVRYVGEGAYWKSDTTYCMPDEANADCKVELNFVCQSSTRDAIKSATRSDDNCIVELEVRTNAAC